MNDQAAAPSPEQSQTPSGEVLPEGETPPDNSTPNPQDAPPTGGSEFAIPEAYQRKENDDGTVENAWSDKVKSNEDLWSQLSNTQKMLGKKNLTPDFSTATPNEIEEYYSQIRPAESSAYNFNKEEGVAKTPVEEGFTQMLYDAGVGQHQGDILIAKYQAMEQEHLTAMYDPDSFIDSMEEHFGRGFETKVEQTRGFIEGNISPEIKAQFDKIPNQFLSTMYQIAASIQESHGVSEGSPNGSGGNMGATPVDIKDVQAGIRKELHELSGRQHTQVEKDALMDKLTKSYEMKT